MSCTSWRLTPKSWMKLSSWRRRDSWTRQTLTWHDLFLLSGNMEHGVFLRLVNVKFRKRQMALLIWIQLGNDWSLCIVDSSFPPSLQFTQNHSQVDNEDLGFCLWIHKQNLFTLINLGDFLFFYGNNWHAVQVHVKFKGLGQKYPMKYLGRRTILNHSVLIWGFKVRILAFCSRTSIWNWTVSPPGWLKGQN